MKTPTILKTSLLATSSIAAIGMAGLWAQDENRRDAAAERRNDPATAQNETRKMEFTGKLVSLTDYLGKQHAYSTDKDSSQSPGASTSSDTATADRSSSTENKPLALLVSGSNSQGSQAGQSSPAGQSPSTPGTPARDSATGSAQMEQLFVLLFDATNQHLAAKAHSICKTAKSASDATKSGASTGAETNAAARTDQSTTSPSAANSKDHRALTVSVSGKKVTRDGLTAIFVEDIKQGD